nr:GNAT family N-acetyltransferase [Chiayiivirga flava]
MIAVYDAARADELDRAPWPPGQRERFVAHQFELQRTQYRAHYPGADFLVIEREGVVVGRVYLHRGAHELRLMDMALLPELRQRGIGTRLLRDLVAWCDGVPCPLTLHVEPFNPAYRLYRRFGFTWRRSTGIYHFLERVPGTPCGEAGMSAWPRGEPGTRADSVS